MQEAVDAEMERKAKLGYKAVIADKNDNPKIVSAKYLVRKRQAAKKSRSNCFLIYSFLSTEKQKIKY